MSEEIRTREYYKSVLCPRCDLAFSVPIDRALSPAVQALVEAAEAVLENEVCECTGGLVMDKCEMPRLRVALAALKEAK